MVPNSDEGTKWIKGPSSTGQKVCPVVVMQNPNIIGTLALKWNHKGHMWLEGNKSLPTFDLCCPSVLGKESELGGKGRENGMKKLRTWKRVARVRDTCLNEQ